MGMELELDRSFNLLYFERQSVEYIHRHGDLCPCRDRLVKDQHRPPFAAENKNARTEGPRMLPIKLVTQPDPELHFRLSHSCYERETPFLPYFKTNRRLDAFQGLRIFFQSIEQDKCILWSSSSESDLLEDIHLITCWFINFFVVIFS